MCFVVVFFNHFFKQDTNTETKSFFSAPVLARFKVFRRGVTCYEKAELRSSRAIVMFLIFILTK